MTFQLYDYQEQAIDDTFARFANGSMRVPLVAATGLGKGHPLDTDVPTPDGWRKWGDLCAGDVIFGRDGSETRVTAVFDRGELPAYRVTFSDESSVDVDGDHLWQVRDSAASGRPWGVMSTSEIARHELKRARGWRFHVPMAGRADYAKTTLPLDPYTVGALISNGSMTGPSGAQLSTPDGAVADRVRAAGLEVSAINDATPGICPRYYVKGVTAVTRALGMRVGSKLKRIPPAYLVADIGSRVALLHGLMDGDGSNRGASRRSVSYYTSSYGLACDVRELVNSLGGTGIVKTYDRGSKGVEFAVRILLPSTVDAFSTSRKGAESGTESVRNLQPKRAIVSIEPIGSREIRCITVDAPDALYLVTRNYIVTHNTEIFVAFADRWLSQNPGKRVLVIAHTNELIKQAAKKARQRLPGRRVGIVKGAAFNQTTAEIIVSSRQTLATEKRRNQLRQIGLIIIDECHHAVDSNSYGRILRHFRALDTCEHTDAPGSLDTKACRPCVHANTHAPASTPVLGVTATLIRGDKAKLSSVWEECTFSRDIVFGIRHGYLLDVKGERVVVDDLNLKNVRTSGGDFSEAALAEELERSFAIETVAKEYVRLAHDRKGLAFWPLVATAEHAAQVFAEAGISSAVVSGQMSEHECAKVYAEQAAGRIQVIHNAMKLTEGYDDPSIECIVNGRPTKSQGLYVQIVGRGLRKRHDVPIEQQRPCLLLDVTGASETNGLRGMIDLSPERDLQGAYDEHPDATLSELEEFFEQMIEEEIGEQRAGASFEFESEQYAGPTTTKAFDPLDRAKAWGVTRGGTYFLRASRFGKGDAFVFLTPALSGAPDAYDIAACSTNATFNVHEDISQPWVSGFPQHIDMPLEKALLFGEEVAGEALNTRKNSWTNRPPAKHLKIKAWRLGIAPGQATHGELQEAVFAHIANERIDTLVAHVKQSVQQSSDKNEASSDQEQG